MSEKRLAHNFRTVAGLIYYSAQLKFNKKSGSECMCVYEGERELERFTGFGISLFSVELLIEIQPCR